MAAVSVFIPTRDRLPLLQRAVASVLANLWTDFELVISDNSTDEATSQWVLTLQDPRLKFVRWTEPLTKAEHWSRAAEQCAGRFLFKLDDDDTIAPNFLHRALAFLQEHPETVAVYTAYAIETSHPERGTKIVQDRTFWSGLNPRPGLEYLRAVLLNEGGYPRNQKTAGVFRRDAAEALGWFRRASEDFAFSAALGLIGPVGYVPEVLYHWHWHDANGVKNWPGSYALSLEAVRGLEKLEEARGCVADWSEVMRKARRNVARFYLVVALAEHGSEVARALAKNVRALDAKSADGVFKAVEFFGGFVPASCIRRALEWYRS